MFLSGLGQSKLDKKLIPLGVGDGFTQITLDLVFLLFFLLIHIIIINL